MFNTKLMALLGFRSNTASALKTFVIREIMKMEKLS